VHTRVSIVIVLVLAGALAVVYWAQARRASLEPADLAQRVASSRPTWENYHEDVKAQVGATPVAQWVGEPESAARVPRGVRVTFLVTGAWAQRDCAPPVLLRDPRGEVHRSVRAAIAGGRVAYSFEWPGSEGALLPWIELRYPHGEKRLVLSEDGTWRR